jgi:epoxyqueuosine reductase QueG
MEELTRKVKEYGASVGASKVGIANAELLKNPPNQEFDPFELIEDVKTAVAFYLSLPESVFDVDPDNVNDVAISRGFTYVTLEREADLIAYRIANFLEKEGYQAVPISTKIPMELSLRGGIAQPYLQRYIAQLAGLGEEGKGNMLLTEDRGPRVIIGSVITNAPLLIDGPNLVGKLCPEGCKICAEECRPRAIDPDERPPYNFNRNRCLWGITGALIASGLDEPPIDWVEAKPNALKVLPAYKKRYPKFERLDLWNSEIGSFPWCTTCIAVCPVGQK